MQKINWKRLNSQERADLIRQCRLGQVDAEIKLENETFIFCGGCVMSVKDTDVFAYPSGKRTKLFGET